MTFADEWLHADIHKLAIWTEHTGEPFLIGTVNYEVRARTCYFEWDSAVIAANLTLSPLCLPPVAGVWSSSAELPRDFSGLPGMLNDALPDGWGAYLMDKALARMGIPPDVITPAVRLAYLGNRAWGSLTFRPMIDESPGEELSLDAWGRGVGEAIEGHLDEVSDELLKAGSPPQGARPKIMVDMSPDGQRARVAQGIPSDGYTSWLIKFAGRDEPEDAPLVEQAYMELARTAGLRVMDSQPMKIGGRLAFATRRFDRVQGRRVFAHTLSGLMHVSHRENGLDYGHVAQMMRLLSTPAESFHEGFARAAFNAAFSVRDDHAKNVAFTLDHTQQWDLSPAYDLTFMDGPGGYHTLTFAESTGKDPTRDDLMRLAGYYGVGNDEAGKIIDRMLHAADNLRQVATGLGARAATVDPWVKRLQQISKGLMPS